MTKTVTIRLHRASDRVAYVFFKREDVSHPKSGSTVAVKYGSESYKGTFDEGLFISNRLLCEIDEDTDANITFED